MALTYCIHQRNNLFNHQHATLATFVSYTNILSSPTSSCHCHHVNFTKQFHSTCPKITSLIAIPVKPSILCTTVRFASIVTTDTTADEFSNQIEKVFHSIQDRLEREDLEFLNLDLNYSDGVLSIAFQNTNNTGNSSNLKGTWILNKHGVTRQLWLSSPISGPSKFNYHRNPAQTGKLKNNKGYSWLSERDSETSLCRLLQAEFSETFGKKVEFSEQF
jgi:frataxin-like iron-binding protein CyaY